MENQEKEILNHWNQKAKEFLLNKKIVDVRYLNDEEMKELGWFKRPIAFMLEDGTSCIVSMDDEGNNGGSLLIGQKDCLPTLY
jgi:hypothetical protein